MASFDSRILCYFYEHGQKKYPFRHFVIHLVLYVGLVPAGGDPKRWVPLPETDGGAACVEHVTSLNTMQISFLASSDNYI
jgi:hypothetical protein